MRSQRAENPVQNRLRGLRRRSDIGRLPSPSPLVTLLQLVTSFQPNFFDNSVGPVGDSVTVGVLRKRYRPYSEQARASRTDRLMGARSATEARAFFIACLRHFLSVVLAREMARHRLRRIPFIGVPRRPSARRQYRRPHAQAARHGARTRGRSTCSRTARCGPARRFHALPGARRHLRRRRARLNGRPVCGFAQAIAASDGLCGG